MSRRTQRVNGLIRDEISLLLQRQVKDPRLGGLVTVTGVSTSADLRHAKIFVSIMGGETEKREALAGLDRASSFFRRELAERISLRRIPELSFRRDDSIERGVHLLKLIERLSSSDTDREAGRS